MYFAIRFKEIKLSKSFQVSLPALVKTGLSFFVGFKNIISFFDKLSLAVFFLATFCDKILWLDTK
jgi:hypothetical protein